MAIGQDASLPAHARLPDGGEARLHDATRLLREFLDVSEMFERALGSDLGVNSTDLEAMEHLLMSGPLAPSELARRLGISTASTTIAIDRLVGLGHVSRVPNPTDRRGVLVVPSPASLERAMSRLRPMIVEVDDVLDEFAPAQREAITQYLARVVALYREHAGADAPTRRITSRA